MSEKTDAALERLEDLIQEKEGENSELREEIAGMKNFSKWEWARHSSIENDTLPTPRIELEFSDLGSNWYETEIVTRLVLPHFLEHSVSIPIDHTKRSGGRPRPPDPSDFPFRGGAHFQFWVEKLGWPAFIRIEDLLWEYRGRGDDRQPICVPVPQERKP